MEILNHIISDKILFEQQLLTYFKNKKNIVFLNSNDNEKTICLQFQIVMNKMRMIGSLDLYLMIIKIK